MLLLKAAATVIKIFMKYNGPKNLDAKTGGPKIQMSVRKHYSPELKAKLYWKFLKRKNQFPKYLQNTAFTLHS